MWPCRNQNHPKPYLPTRGKRVSVRVFRVIVEGYQAKNGENRANGSNITFADGKRLFLGGSNPNEQPQ